VLVYGAFADGSSYKKSIYILKARGYNVGVVCNPNTGLDDDVAATKRVLDRKKQSPNVVGLVYIGAFAPDEGESLGQLLSGYPDDPKSGILPL
jgi:hypothetical protein